MIPESSVLLGYVNTRKRGFFSYSFWVPEWPTLDLSGVLVKKALPSARLRKECSNIKADVMLVKGGSKIIRLTKNQL